MVAPAPAPAPAAKEDRKANAQARQKLQEQARPIKAELKKVDERLAALNTERDQINARLCQSNLGATELGDKGKRLKAIEDELGGLEMRWLELNEAIESLSAD